MLAKLAEHRRRAARVANAGGGERYVERHHARGKLLARERIELLLDQDSPFLELSPLAAWGTDVPRSAPAWSPGSASSTGVECVLIAHDPTVQGGRVEPVHVEEGRCGRCRSPGRTGCR